MGLFDKYEGIAPSYNNADYTKIPMNRIDVSEAGAEEFNKIYKYILSRKDDFDIIRRIKSGGISRLNFFNHFPAFDIRQLSKAALELTYLGEEGFYRFLFSPKYLDDDGVGCSGREAYNTFNDICKKKFNIDLEDYMIDNGLEVKETIESPPIGLFNGDLDKDIVINNAHHLDLNSSYMAGVAEAFPELKEAINFIYEGRKEHREYKDILTHSYGFFQSYWCRSQRGTKERYALAHFSKAALDFNNREIYDLTDQLTQSGRYVIAHNSDGIWYAGDIFHNSREGKELGMWKNDHTNCKIRFKSDGAYEYIENGKYTPVVRGSTRLDRQKTRDKWQWGDIYKSPILMFKFVEGEGIIAYEKEI